MRALVVTLVVTLFAVWQVAARVGPFARPGRARPGTSQVVAPSAYGSPGIVTPARATGTYALNRPDTVLVWQAHRYVRGSSGSVTYFTVPPDSLPTFAGGKRYLMRIRNGDTTGTNTGRISAAYVQVNGREVMSASDIGTGIPTCVKVIRPTAATTLVIGVSGAAGCYADITLYETPDPSYDLRGPQTFVMGELPEEITPGGNYTEFTDQVQRGSGDLGPYHLLVTNGLADGTLRCSGVKVYLDGTLVVSSGSVNGNVGEYVQQVSLPNTTTALMVRLYGNPGDQAMVRFIATDATQPELAVLTPQQSFMTQQDTTTIRFRTNDQTVLDSALVNGMPASFAGQDAAGLLWNYAATVPNQGRNEFVIRARNRAGYACDSLRTVIRDNFAPVLTVDSLSEATPRTVTTSTLTVRGHWHDSTPTIVTVDGDAVGAAADSGAFAVSVPLDMGSNGIHFRAVDHFGQTTEFKRFVVRQAENEAAPASGPTPSTHTPTEVAAFFDRVSFLWSGSGPVQTGVPANTMDAARLSVIRGRVLGRDVGALANVIVRVVGHAEYGQTLTRADGVFDLAVNAGAPVTLEFAKTDFLLAQRTVEPTLLDFVQVPDVALLGRSTRQYAVNTSTAQKVVSRFESDLNGDRRLTLVFQQGTRCTLSVGATTSTTTDFHVRAKEYTVGADGEEAMPGTLPPSSAYTYCVNLSTVEGDDMAGAGPPAKVAFDRPVSTYVREFLGARVGTAVPSGSYDFTTGHWVPSEDGLIVRIKGRGRSLANIDSDTLAANNDSLRNVALGFTEDEVELITNEYAIGDSLWRVRLMHFSPHDYNFNRAAVAAAQAMSPGSIASLGTLITDPGMTCACVIENENRVLGEEIPIVGTPYSLHYRSSRQPGDVSMRWLHIPLTGSASDAALVRVHVTVDVAGRRYSHSFSRAEAGTPWEFKEWDGTDVYGRRVVGSVTATVRRGYEFKERWAIQTGGSGGNSFGSGARSSSTAWPASGNRDVGRILWTTQQVAIGVPSMAAAGLGGWTISPHHIYDRSGMGMKYRGDGTMQRGAAQFPVITAWAGNGLPSGTGALPPVGHVASEGRISPADMVATADGAICFTDAGTHTVGRVSENRIYTPLAGTGNNSATPAGAGEVATDVALSAPDGLALAADGTLYFADAAHKRIYKIVNGRLWRVAGSSSGIYVDDSLAIQSSLVEPRKLAFSPDGSLYFSDRLPVSGWHVIRRIGTDGRVRTVAGGKIEGISSGEGVATELGIESPQDLVFDDQGNLYFSEKDRDRVRRIAPDGMLTTYLTSSAPQLEPTALAFGPEGLLYVSQNYTSETNKGVFGVVRREVDGSISSVVGGYAPQGKFGAQDFVRAQSALFVFVSAIAFNARGELFVGEKGSGGASNGISKVFNELPGAVAGEIAHPSDDGALVDVFTAGGRHKRTMNAFTNRALYSFEYDGAGRLTKIIDANQDETLIERNVEGVPLRILAPRGQVTELDVQDGYLRTVTNPANETITLGYAAGGLLTSFENAAHHAWTYEYTTDEGRLASEKYPGNNSTRTLTSDTSGAARTVTHRSPGGRITVHELTQMLDGMRNRVTRYPDHSVEVETLHFRALAPLGEETVRVEATGEELRTRPSRDTRFGWWAPVTSFESLHVPVANLGRVVSRTRSWGAQVIEQTVVNGKTYTSSYDTTLRRLTTTTPVGRMSRVYFDAAGHPLTLAVPGLNNVTLHYDSHGQLDHLSQGARSWDYAYDALGQLTSVTNQANDATLCDVHDGAGRVKSLKLPGQRHVRFGYDAVGNLDSLTTPNNTTHTFAYTPTNLNATYSPPPVDGVPNPATSYEYDADHLLTKVTRPDGGIVDLTYETATGQLAHAEFPSAGSTTPRWQMDYSYWNGMPSGSTPGGGLLRKADRVGMAAVEYLYDGSLPTRERWSGRVQGAVGRTYDSFFRPATDTVSAGNTARAVGYVYDNDGLLTGISASDNSWAYALHRSATTGMLDSTHVASTSGVAVTSTADYDGYGDLANLRYSVGGAELFLQSIHHDDRGRVDEISERWNGGTPKVTSYGYDAAGRLSAVTVNGVLEREYGYDPNGNRTGESVPLPGGGFALVAGGVYDEQDRLLSYGEGAFPAPTGMTWLSGGPPLTTYAHTANGERTTKTVSGGGPTTCTTYDAMGALVGASTWTDSVLSDSVTFALDGQHRRVAAYRNGAFERGWLYEGISVVAELSDSATLAHRFVYGTRDHVPDLMWDADSAIACRLVTDHLGSVRAVVRITDGAIMQRTDYDAWGEVTAESNPALQSLGFAGGLRERTTELVRFGARDYDASVGRWTSKDPAGFDGGAVGLMEYVGSSPATYNDPSGLSVVGDEDVPIDIDYDILLTCLQEVLGIKDVIIVLGPAGLPIIGKRVTLGGGSTRTSPLSVGMRKLLGKSRFPGGVRLPTPTYGSSRAASSKLATVLARYAPVVGWTLTAFDLGRVMECYRAKLAGQCPIGAGAP
ncbi:MAG: RHS repeat-associated core domain-containing protein [Candidatus Eisenbacteria bacterium]